MATATSNDTTTQLNPASGGDKMFESAVPLQDGTTAKMPRVVLFDDTGNVIPHARLLGAMLEEQRKTNEMLAMLLDLASR